MGSHSRSRDKEEKKARLGGLFIIFLLEVAPRLTEIRVNPTEERRDSPKSGQTAIEVGRRGTSVKSFIARSDFARSRPLPRSDAVPWSRNPPRNVSFHPAIVTNQGTGKHTPG